MRTLVEDDLSTPRLAAVAIAAVAIVRDEDDDDDDDVDLAEEVECAEVCRRSDVLLAIHGDEELGKLFMGGPRHGEPRLCQAADACEMAVLVHVCTYDGDDYVDYATLNESEDVPAALVALAKASTSRRLTYVVNKKLAEIKSSARASHTMRRMGVEDRVGRRLRRIRPAATRYAVRRYRI